MSTTPINTTSTSSNAASALWQQQLLQANTDQANGNTSAAKTDVANAKSAYASANGGIAQGFAAAADGFESKQAASSAISAVKQDILPGGDEPAGTSASSASSAHHGHGGGAAGPSGPSTVVTYDANGNPVTTTL